jgi:hypothetical protein
MSGKQEISRCYPEQRRSIILCKMLLKEKTLADGSFDKIKSRIVAGGQMQDRDIYGSSPTISTTSVLIIAALAAKKRRSY